MKSRTIIHLLDFQLLSLGYISYMFLICLVMHYNVSDMSQENRSIRKISNRFPGTRNLLENWKSSCNVVQCS